MLKIPLMPRLFCPVPRWHPWACVLYSSAIEYSVWNSDFLTEKATHRRGATGTQSPTLLPEPLQTTCWKSHQGSIHTLENPTTTAISPYST